MSTDANPQNNLELKAYTIPRIEAQFNNTLRQELQARTSEVSWIYKHKLNPV